MALPLSSSVDAPSNNPRTDSRWLDWRFLLPKPPSGAFRNLVLLGGPRSLPQEIKEAGIALRIQREIPAHRSADAIIVLHNSPVRLTASDIADCLLPGGVLYYESAHGTLPSLPFSARRIRRSLKSKGLSLTGLYWTVANGKTRQLYLPLDAPGAIHWYFHNLFVASTLPRRLLRFFLEKIGWIRKHLLIDLVPEYAITAVAGAAQQSPLWLFTEQGLPTRFLRADLHPLVLTPGEDDLNRVVLFPFPADGNQPIAVLKAARQPERNSLTENEQFVLGQIHSTVGENLASTIPVPIATIRWNRLSIAVQSCAAGSLLSASLNQWARSLRHHKEDLGHVVRWLAEFHCHAPLKRSLWDEAAVRHWVKEPITEYIATFPVTALERQLFAALLDRAHELVGLALPMVWVHWGFTDRNLFRNEEFIVVIDWEGGSAGPPLLDLLYFLTCWNTTVRHLQNTSEQVRGFEKLFCITGQKDAIHLAIKAAIDAYMTTVNIDERFIPLFLVIMCMLRSLGRTKRQQHQTNSQRNRDHQNIYHDYIHVVAQYRNRLFPDA